MVGLTYSLQAVTCVNVEASRLHGSGDPALASVLPGDLMKMMASRSHCDNTQALCRTAERRERHHGGLPGRWYPGGAAALAQAYAALSLTDR